MGHDLQQTRYDQLIRRVGAIIGPGSKVAEALSELFPVIDVERVPGELLLLGGTNLCLGSGLVAAVAAESSRIQVFNPEDSGKLITVTLAIITSNASKKVRYARTNTALLSGLGTEVFRDTRLAGTSRPVGQIRSDTTVALTDANGRFIMLANTPVFLRDENSIMVLSPGSGFEVGAGDLNESIEVTFHWRERVAEQSELNL